MPAMEKSEKGASSEMTMLMSGAEGSQQKAARDRGEHAWRVAGDLGQSWRRLFSQLWGVAIIDAG